MNNTNTLNKIQRLNHVSCYCRLFIEGTSEDPQIDESQILTVVSD